MPQQLVWNVGFSPAAEASAENRLQRGSICFPILRARDCGWKQLLLEIWSFVRAERFHSGCGSPCCTLVGSLIWRSVEGWFFSPSIIHERACEDVQRSYIHCSFDRHREWVKQSSRDALKRLKSTVGEIARALDGTIEEKGRRRNPFDGTISDPGCRQRQR